MITLKRRTAAVTLAAAVAAILAASATAPSASSRSFATCNPNAYVPILDVGRTAYARGFTSCDAGAPSWNYTIRLANHAGDVLTQASGGPVNGSSTVSTAATGCAGAIVHSFLYINVGGTGKSDTSGEISC
jgi:hypothetical protein